MRASHTAGTIVLPEPSISLLKTCMIAYWSVPYLESNLRDSAQLPHGAGQMGMVIWRFGGLVVVRLTFWVRVKAHCSAASLRLTGKQ
jgi:hypothetical protein